MLTGKSLVMAVAALSAVSAKQPKAKRKCPAPTTTIDEPIATPTPTVSPPPPGGGGGQPPATGEYSESHNFVGQEWYKGWEWWGFPDPTHGRVEYVDFDTAVGSNLTSLNGDKLIMRAEASGVLDPNGPGRRSVRIQTRDAFTVHTAVIDVAHMPEGQGTWPAWWTCGENWPAGGELDLIEGVNDGSRNLMSLHTSKGCTQPVGGSRKMTGEPAYHDCDAYSERGNQGCGVVSRSENSFGPNFNSGGGGFYATERTGDYIKVWIWNRGDKNIPADVLANKGAVSPSKWGDPVAHFVNDECSLAEKFGPNKYIINLTLCGDWAGNAYPQGAQACIDHVNNNPEAFTNSYWDLNRMSVYE